MIPDQCKAWLVHLFTASGLIAGLLALIAVSDKDWRAAMAWLLVALAIDGIDGTLARAFKVKEVLPSVNGTTIDHVVDFANYAIVPAYFFYMAELAPAGWNLPLAILILLVSALYYGKDGMVSDDYYFVGFPVMWNVVVFYLIFVFPDIFEVLAPQPSALVPVFNASIVVIFSALHFVPVKFAYPSRATRMKIPTIAATVSILVLMPVIVWLYPSTPVWLAWLALINLAYFGVLAVVDTATGTEN